MHTLAGVACAIALVALALLHLGSTGSDLARQLDVGSSATPRRQATLGGVVAGADIHFTEWARRVMRGRSSYRIASPVDRLGPATDPWLTYRLMPARDLSVPSRVDALIWYHDPGGIARRPRRWHLWRYGPGSAIAMSPGAR